MGFDPRNFPGDAVPRSIDFALMTRSYGTRQVPVSHGDEAISGLAPARETCAERLFAAVASDPPDTAWQPRGRASAGSGFRDLVTGRYRIDAAKRSAAAAQPRAQALAMPAH